MPGVDICIFPTHGSVFSAVLAGPGGQELRVFCRLRQQKTKTKHTQGEKTENAQERTKNSTETKPRGGQHTRKKGRKKNKGDETITILSSGFMGHDTATQTREHGCKSIRKPRDCGCKNCMYCQACALPSSPAHVK